MFFRHSDEIWHTFPRLAAGTLYVRDRDGSRDVSSAVSSLWDAARARHAATMEAELPEIQAWRRAFATMGLKPTQYRCAAESLLRRFRKEGELPRLHPLVDLCNGVSLLYATPIAVFDLARVSGFLEVRPATGDEVYTPFSGPDETPDVGEVIFADAEGRAHARRWTNRQSGYSAVGPATASALIVAEALHETAATDMRALLDALAPLVEGVAGTVMRGNVITGVGGRFDF